MQKVLILRFSSIGDIALTTPVVRCIKNQFPKCEIHYLTKPTFASILENNPYISKVHILNKPIIELALELKQEGFDTVIDLHNNLRTRILKSILDLPAYSFDKLNTEKWLRVNGGINLLPTQHIVERYMECVTQLGIQNDQKGLDYFIPDNTTLPLELPKEYIAVAIGAQHGTKRLPTDLLIQLCQSIQSNIILLGGKENQEEGQQIVANVGKHVTNLCGPLTLNQSALVIKNASRVITHDTGLMHIAAALQKEVISIWGNTIPEFGMTPYYGMHSKVRSTLFEVPNLSCRPCSKIGYAVCPKSHFNCMRMQPINAIAKCADGN